MRSENKNQKVPREFRQMLRKIIQFFDDDDDNQDDDNQKLNEYFNQPDIIVLISNFLCDQDLISLLIVNK